MPPAISTAPPTDVIVIGGGVIGCSIALRLAERGLHVAVYDRGEPGAEASAAAAGMLAPQGEMTQPNAFFELAAASRDLYPDFVRHVEVLSGQRVGLRRDGTMMVALSEDEERAHEDIFRGQTQAGLPLDRLTARQARALVPQLSSDVRSALFVAGDHWLDNERLAKALAAACRRAGVALFANSRVTALEASDGTVTGVRVSKTGGRDGALRAAAQYVLAAGAWSAQLAAPLGLSLGVEPCRGQMIEFEGAPDFPLIVRAGHHYLVPRANGRLLAGTTAEQAGFEKNVTGEGLRSILEGTIRLTPLVRSLRFRRAWAGLRPDTLDHFPILGRGMFRNLVFATGHFRNGILLAPITAQLISELLLTGHTSHPIEAYSPARFEH